MDPIIHFGCHGCDAKIAIRSGSVIPTSCPHCGQDLNLSTRKVPENGENPTSCISCGHGDFYIQKDFNRNLGLAIVITGIAVSLYFFSQEQPMLAMGALGLTALVDFLVYFLVGEVTVCYSCHAVYRGFERNPEHEPFDLKKLEKYGGRNPRG